jgi:adenylosuccinate synthase
LARYAAQVNAIDSVAITKLDVLDSFTRVKVCVGYRLHDTELEHPPSDLAVLSRVEPIYEELPGWNTPTNQARRFDQLPEEARSYVARLCELIGARLDFVSVGPDRGQLIEVSRPF